MAEAGGSSNGPVAEAGAGEAPLSRRLEGALLSLMPRVSSRLGLHLAVALVVLGVSLLRGAGFWGERSLRVVNAGTSAEFAIPAGFDVQPLESGGVLLRSPVPRTIIPLRPREALVAYVVQPNDTLYGIAEKFGITAETIAWANSDLGDRPNLLSTGQALIIPPTSGVLHTVQSGDSLEGIAKKYKVAVSTITEFGFNRLEDPPLLKAGQKLMVPGGDMPPAPTPVPTPRPVVKAQPTPVPAKVPQATAAAPAPTPKPPAPLGRGRFVWPASGVITQNYWNYHRAIDIAAAKGTPIYASDSGVVVYAGWSKVGYGYYILLDHGNGFQTLYGHLSWYDVDPGQRVVQGQQIGRIGSTGYSTGSHLHFEIILNGVNQNPFNYLGR